MTRFRWGLVALAYTFTAWPAHTFGQAEDRPPRLFEELRGTWTLDADAGSGRIAGLPVARTLTISTSPSTIEVVKDRDAAQVHRLDGTETFDGGFRRRFTLVAGAVALTQMRPREDRGRRFTNIITDGYTASGDVLTVERQLSVLVEPPGQLATLQDPRNNRQTLVYRRIR